MPFGWGKKAADVAAEAFVRKVVREEIQTELNRIMSPTFMEIVTRGQADMAKIFDAVIAFQEELDEVKLSLKILQRALQPPPGGG